MWALKFLFEIPVVKHFIRLTDFQANQLQSKIFTAKLTLI